MMRIPEGQGSWVRRVLVLALFGAGLLVALLAFVHALRRAVVAPHGSA